MNTIKTVYLGADHAGFELKEKLKGYLSDLGYQVIDKGAYGYDPEDDYPDYVRPVAESVLLDPASRGIVMGGSGQGEAIVANRIPGIRTTVFYDGPGEIIRLSRQHNDANILSLGARFIKEEDAIKAIKLWLETPFDGGRHERRIRKIDNP